MAVIAADIKYFKSTDATTVAGNTNGALVDSLGGVISANEIISNSNHNLFDAVTSAEALAGRIEHRLIYVTNQNASQTLFASKVFVATDTVAADTLIEIALDPAAVGADSSLTIADETDSGNALVGLTFSTANSFANGLDVGDMTFGTKKAVWVRRTITAGATAAAETATLEVQGDTAA